MYSLMTCLGSDNLGKLYFAAENEIKSLLDRNKVRTTLVKIHTHTDRQHLTSLFDELNQLS